MESKINYTKKLNKEIQNVVKRYNAKITRLNKRGVVITPPKIKVSDLKTKDTSSLYFSYDTKELKQRLRDMKRFLNKGAEETITLKSGIEITRYERDLLKRQRSRALKRINREIEEYGNLHLRQAGSTRLYQNQTYKEIGNLTYRNLLAKKDYLKTHKLNSLQKAQFNYYKMFLKRQTESPRDELWKQNYIDILRSTANQYGYDKNKTDEIIKELDKLSPREFKIAYNEEVLLQAVYDYYLQLESSTSMDAESFNTGKKTFDDLYDSIDIVITNAKTTARDSRIKY